MKQIKHFFFVGESPTLKTVTGDFHLITRGENKFYTEKK